MYPVPKPDTMRAGPRPQIRAKGPSGVAGLLPQRRDAERSCVAPEWLFRTAKPLGCCVTHRQWRVHEGGPGRSEIERRLPMWEMEVDAALIRRMENMSDVVDRLGLAGAGCSERGSAPVFGSAVRVCESCAAGDVCH